uniref:Uncharacterized protein n=1 Tax=Marmota marmota marmota TaxID=9994 RepID=A0A8C5YVM6_MARMA
MGSRCAKLSTGHGTGQGTGHSRGHESSMKKLVACMSQDNFSLSSEGEEEEQEEEEEEEEEEEQLPGQGKLLLMEPERQEGSAEDNPGGPRRAPRPSRRTCNARGPGGVPAAGPARTSREESIKCLQGTPFSGVPLLTPRALLWPQGRPAPAQWVESGRLG